MRLALAEMCSKRYHSWKCNRLINGFEITIVIRDYQLRGNFMSTWFRRLWSCSSVVFVFIEYHATTCLANTFLSLFWLSFPTGPLSVELIAFQKAWTTNARVIAKPGLIFFSLSPADQHIVVFCPNSSSHLWLSICARILPSISHLRLVGVLSKKSRELLGLCKKL
jgi:hypothetical protein